MEVWNSDWIDPALTVIGYLLAGGLGAVIYAARVSRRTATASAPSRKAATVAARATAAERPTDEPVARRKPAAAGGQFVDLSGFNANSETADTSASTKAEKKPAGGHRDRKEIVRIATEMLKAGTSPQMIRRTLPITEAELALLQYANTK